MIEHAAAFLHGLPVLCLFLSILLGTVIGRFHFKGVGLGSVVGTLIAGIAIGILADPELPEMLRWSFFSLFLFSIGYSVARNSLAAQKRKPSRKLRWHWSWHSQGSSRWSPSH